MLDHPFHVTLRSLHAVHVAICRPVGTALHSGPNGRNGVSSMIAHFYLLRDVDLFQIQLGYSICGTYEELNKTIELLPGA